MASLMRPGLLRQGFAHPAAAAQRMLSTAASSSMRQASPLAQQLRPAFARTAAAPKASRIAAFHATQRQQILPPLPQKVVGTTNDPTPVPDPAPAHGSYHWSFERFVAAGLVPLTIAPFAAGSLNPVMDSLLCALLVFHSHVGFESCIIDYFPKARIPVLRNLAMWVLRIGTVALGVALYSFETNDIGITELIIKLWHA